MPSISDFQIIRPISKGAFGRVYLARKIVTGDFFAVKVQRKDKALGHGANAKRVMSERDILVHADHPFIVKLFFCFQSKHNLYLVMEYLAGGDLHALLKSVGRFEEQLASIYLAEIVLGLEYLHETLRIVTATADSRIEHARIGGRARPRAQSSHASPLTRSPLTPVQTAHARTRFAPSAGSSRPQARERTDLISGAHQANRLWPLLGPRGRHGRRHTCAGDRACRRACGQACGRWRWGRHGGQCGRRCCCSHRLGQRKGSPS